MNYLKQANESLRLKNYEVAIELYVRALQQPTALPQVIQSSLKIAQSRYLKSRQDAKPRVCVSAWSLSHNAAGRAATLAQLYQSLADVQIIGCHFKKWGIETWAPLRNIPISIHGIDVQDETQFVNQALELVLNNPCDLLHLSKPRFPNIIIGLLYKLIWGSKVVVDIDDEELSFVSATKALALNPAHLPNLADLTGKEWTRIAVGLANAFDGTTVVNPALQKKYGGTIVRHARDESVFKPSFKRRQESRLKLGIAPEQKVVLFLGTPRTHKGLLETALAIAQLKREDVLFLVVGEFPVALQAHQQKIEALLGSRARFLGDQPFETIPDILAAGDICVLLQDQDSLAAQFQTPAKLSDALAMGLTVLAEDTPALIDLADAGAFQPVTQATLAATLAKVLDQLSANPSPHPVFVEKLSLAANRPVLQTLLKQTVSSPLSNPLQQLASSKQFSGVFRALIGQQKSALTPSQPVAKSPSLTLPPENAETEAYIQLAGKAMSVDDWAGAYRCWQTLFERQGSKLKAEMLLRISRELFKLDAFTEAALVLKQAAANNPNHPGVLCEQAAQYYYHCYSSWLMLVTENEPDWYKADGLDKRPDWQTACDLIEKAEKAAPRNNLRRYVQAYLLLAEEAWGKHQRTEAHVALRTALNAIGPNKLDKAITAAIFHAIDQFRDSKVDEKDPYHITLQDQLKALPLELLSVPDWLCLNDILNWNGLLLCGYVAREKAVNFALAQGKANPNNKDLLKTALKAALDCNDTAQADNFLAKLKHISMDALDVRELDSCCELIKGNLNAFRQKWPHPPTPAEQRMKEYLKGKTVAVVGPAPSESLDGEEIDSYDVVVRMNWRGEAYTGKNMAKYGSRADVSLYNAHTIRKFIKDNQLQSLPSLTFMLTRRSYYKNSNHSQLSKSTYLIHEYPGSLYKSMNAIPAILFNFTLLETSSLTLFTTNFYTSIDHHAPGYRVQRNEKDEAYTIKNLRTVLANHDLLTQKKHVYLLWRLGTCNLQLETAKIISLKNDDYFKKVIASTVPNVSHIINEDVAQKLIKEDSHLDCYMNFIHNEGVLKKEQLSYIDSKINKELKTKNVDLSFMNLEEFKRYIRGKSIALVANSAQLLKQSFGETIDGHDLVIRFNSFKIDEKYTGKKTDIHVSVYLQKENLNVFVPVRFILSNHLVRWIDAIKELSLYSQSFFLKYNHHTSIKTSFKDKTPPTSGFVTLTLLLKLGGFKRIDLFGFTFYEGGGSSILRNDKGTEEGVSKIHDYNFEKDAIFVNANEYDKETNIFTFLNRNVSLDGLKC